jgi:hypothetical protein
VLGDVIDCHIDRDFQSAACSGRLGQKKPALHGAEQRDELAPSPPKITVTSQNNLARLNGPVATNFTWKRRGKRPLVLRFAALAQDWLWPNCDIEQSYERVRSRR